MEDFVRESPYTLHRADARYWIHRDGDRVSPVDLSPKPAWYERKTTSGTPMRRIGSLQGTYLGVYPAKVCEYWTEDTKTNCKFCSVGLNLGVDDADEKSVEEVMEVVWAALDESDITYIDFNTGHYSGHTFLYILQPYILETKKRTDILIGIQTPPHPDLTRFKRLKEMGVNRVSFCFEIYDRERFAEVCPGKHREYGLDTYLEAMDYCATLGNTGSPLEPWVANGEIIAGLEPPESSIAAIDRITGAGAIPTVCVFRPLQGTDYEDVAPPRTEDMIPVFRRLYEACMEKGLPIGVAPNIHVSLVLLPEECRWFSDRSYTLGEMKLKAMAKIFGAQFRHKTKKIQAQNRPAALPAAGTS